MRKNFPAVASARLSPLVILAAAAAPAASAQLAEGAPLTGSITVGAAERLADPAARLGGGIEFRAEVFRNEIFGVNAADAFIDATTGGVAVGIERTAGSAGVSSDTPVVFTLSGLTGVAAVERLSGDLTRAADFAFSDGTLTVTLPGGFTVGSGNPSQSLTLGFTPVPEPAAALLLAGPAAVLLSRRR